MRANVAPFGSALTPAAFSMCAMCALTFCPISMTSCTPRPTPSRVVALLEHTRRGLLSEDATATALGICSELASSLLSLLQPQLEQKWREVVASRKAVGHPAAAAAPAAAATALPPLERRARLREVLANRQHLVVVLEDCGNPGNAAAVLRCADCFGVAEVLLVSAVTEPFDLSEARRKSASASRWVKTRSFDGPEACVGCVNQFIGFHRESARDH